MRTDPDPPLDYDSWFPFLVRLLWDKSSSSTVGNCPRIQSYLEYISY